jgi:hypothetical protein
MAEGLGDLFKETTDQGKWKGLNIHGEEKPTTHQQFVDDMMSYGKSNYQRISPNQTSSNGFFRSLWNDNKPWKIPTLLFQYASNSLSPPNRYPGFPTQHSSF